MEDNIKKDLKQQDGRGWSWLIWFRIGTRWRLFWVRGIYY